MNRLDIIYEDADLLVVDKPDGILTVPGGFSPGVATIQQILEPAYGRLWIVHRLDLDTSGVLILAKNADMHRNLNLLFDSRQVTKQYKCLVFGEPPDQRICLPLRVNTGRSHLTVVDELSGKQAETEIRQTEMLKGFSLVEAHPYTGYTHQIRAHLAAIGHPILLDLRYTRPAINEKIKSDGRFRKIESNVKRMMLHCSTLKLTHPRSGEELSFHCDVPADFSLALSILRDK